MIWTEPKNHIDDCYSCVIELHGINKRKITYLDLSSSKGSRLYTDEHELNISFESRHRNDGRFS